MFTNRTIVGWGAIVVFTSISFLHGMNLTCPGATDLVLKSGKCELNDNYRFVCVPGEATPDIFSCVSGRTTKGQMEFCSKVGDPCFSAVQVNFDETRQCSEQGASGMVLARSERCS